MRKKYPLNHATGRNKEHAKKAYKLVHRAIRKGQLQPKPCVICGTMEKICAHHKDYSQPLNIIWLCKTHHFQLHLGKIQIG